MRCAWLIDQNRVEEAQLILEPFRKDAFSDENEEKDVEMVVHSLFGLLNERSEQGQASMQRAQALISDLGVKYEHKQWLRLPLLFF